MHVEHVGVDATLADLEDAGRHVGRDRLAAPPVTRALHARVELPANRSRSWKAARDAEVEAAPDGLRVQRWLLIEVRRARDAPRSV
ncbi:MAG: hypothetical protein DMD78_27990 [Candidatus Rokuibacteriota bacterium]|nr:MAG: hypothetical protein DMD78_27990 [Candidatus Rokubacteria bacterium]